MLDLFKGVNLSSLIVLFELRGEQVQISGVSQHPLWWRGRMSSRVPYSRKLLWVKTFANFVVLPASAKVLSANFSARGLGECVGFSKTQKFYREMLCFIEFAKVFTRESFRLYGIRR